MAVNLTKNKDLLLAAWKDVLDDKTKTNWALFGYEGLTNDLKTVSTGCNGIEELTEDLNSGKIMYAFLQVLDPKTSLPKNVLINWQGEGAPNVRKGTCANHVRDISNFFKGAHVTMNARTEEEVDYQLIIDKVSKSTGSAYSFKERTEHAVEAGPVGTAYKRVIPKQEINAQERDKFWEKEEQEERQRQEEERSRKEEERRKLEEERKRRESEETAKREAKTFERNKSINQLREAEKSNSGVGSRKEEVVEDMQTQEQERRERSEMLRRQRSQEAQQLIAKRTIDARAVFEQNTSAGQMSRRRASYQPASNGPASHAVESHREPEPVKVSPPTQHVQPEPVVHVQHNPTNGNHVEDFANDEQEWEDDVKHEIPVTNAVSPSVVPEQNILFTNNVREPVQEQQPSSKEEVGEYANGEFGLSARALYDYQAADSTEITFDPGDLITHIDQIDEGWWHGLGPHGEYGLFPANYVELI